MKLMQTHTLHTDPPPRNKSLAKLRRAAVATALSVLIARSALLSISASAAAQTAIDYDSDVDGYIDVDNLVKLNAIRCDLNGYGATNPFLAQAFADTTRL